jgi:hypothetical protein
VLGFVDVLIGSGLILAGRRLFWLVLGALGFMLGLDLAGRFEFHSALMLVLAALALGVLFAFLAVFAETVAIGIAGFLGGGFCLARFVTLLGIDLPVFRILAFIFGGLIGLALVFWVFDWGLILISSALGASLVCSATSLPDLPRLALFFALLFVGVLIQSIGLYRDRTLRKERHPNT